MNTVAIIGKGTIGAAIASRLEINFNLIVLDSKTSDYSVIDKAEIVVIAVKPQQFLKLSESIATFCADKIIISVMAGVKIQTIRESLTSTKIVRTMPNIGITTGGSMTALLSRALSSANEKLVSEIVTSWGQHITLDNEDKFDSFTALAGSGPAYYFELTSIIEKIAESEGFSATEARAIANATMRASAEQLPADQSAADKVTAVASRGGTTERALQSLQANNFRQTITKAVQEAKNRSKELSND